ncbi:MAG TPA: hypothetical protein VKG26_01565 [Bacteroidia bacterium]|nr:hypothetical protein [Bacteroidia bacterium]
MKIKFAALTCIILALQTGNMHAQTDDQSVIKNGLGISLAPMLTIPSFVNQNNYAGNTTKAGFGAMAALCQNIVLSKKHGFYFYLELGYLTTAYIDQTASTIIINPNTNGNTVSGTSKLLDRDNNGFFSLSIQKVLFHLGNKAGMFLGLGAQANYCFSKTVTFQETTTNGQTTTTTFHSTSNNVSPDNQWSASALARLGIFINPTKHLGLNLAPVFYYGLNPKYVFTNNQPGYNSLGFNVQIMYNF